MRRVKQISISKYIMRYAVMLIVVIAAVLLGVVKVMADSAIRYDVQTQLSKEMLKNVQHLTSQDGNLYPDDSFWYEKDGIIFQIVTRDGTVILGNLPEDTDVGEGVEVGKLRTVKIGAREYYLYDRGCRSEIQGQMTQEVFARCLIRCDDMTSAYQTLEQISYLVIAVFAVLMFVFGSLLSGRISRPLMQMADTVNEIGHERSLARRMRYDGRIRELKLLADRSNQMLSRLEEMFASQKQFSSDVAHELRTPVAVLLAQCEYARENAQTPEEYAQTLDVIYRQSKKANDIVARLLDMNRMENGKVAPELEEADLSDLIRAIGDETLENAQKTVRIHYELADVTAQIDVGLIYVLLGNLVQNAVKYSPQPADIEITLSEDKDAVRVAVTDHGDGISEADLRSIFLPFYRVERARSSEGYGLGLPLCERIARLHGGRIEVESTLGEGSTFTLILPKKRKEKESEKTD